MQGALQLGVSEHRRLGTSGDEVKTQLWIPTSVYVLVTILRKRLAIDTSLHTMLEILLITTFEQVQLCDGLTREESDAG